MEFLTKEKSSKKENCVNNQNNSEELFPVINTWVTSSYLYYFSIKKTQLVVLKKGSSLSEPFKTHLLKRGWMPPHPTVFMRREVYMKHGFFYTQLRCSADYDYILRVFSDDTLTFHYLPEVITKMRMGGISTYGIKNLIKKKIEDYYVLKKNNMPFPFLILMRKNLSKINQLFPRISNK